MIIYTHTLSVDYAKGLQYSSSSEMANMKLMTLIKAQFRTVVLKVGFLDQQHPHAWEPDVQILGSHFRATKPKALRTGPRICALTNPPDDFDTRSSFENCQFSKTISTKDGLKDMTSFYSSK